MNDARIVLQTIKAGYIFFADMNLAFRTDSHKHLFIDKNLTLVF